jgi:hypothetical protein
VLGTRLRTPGSFPAVTPRVFSLTSAPDGGWPSHITDAHHYGGKTFFGYVDSAGNIEARAFDHSTLETSAPSTLHAALEADIHNGPALFVRDSDKRIVAVYTRHNGTALFRRISTNPGDISAWGAEGNIDSQVAGERYTYPVMHQLLGETDDPLYLFTRDRTGGSVPWPSKLLMSKSTDGGVTWAAKTYLWSTSKMSYWRIDSNGLDRIDFVVTDGSAEVDDADAYHFYYSGGSYYKSDGSLITASPPFGPSDVTRIYDGGTTAGIRAIWGLSWNAGDPVAVFVTWPASGSVMDYRYAVYSGGVWTSRLIVSAGASSTFTEGGLALYRSDPRIVYLSKHDGSQWHMFRYRTVDQGVTWQANRITYSGGPHILPHTIQDGAGELKAVWLEGSFTAFNTFSLGINGTRL